MLEGLTFKEANSSERVLALELRHVVYHEEFGHVPVDDLDERAYHLVACNHENEVIATLRIVGPHQRPFDIETYVNLSELLPGDRSPAFIGRLCIHREYRGVNRKSFLPLGMLKLAYNFARKRRITDFLTYTYPNLYQFYRGAFFEPLIPAFEHTTWGKVCVMHLDLEDLEARCSQSQQPLARFLFATDLPNIVV